MNLPNLIIPGAGKAGTSTLYAHLNSHPQVCMSVPKEPHFFADSNYFAKGFAKYQELFTRSADVIGEASTSYLHFPHVIERIKTLPVLPKFIILLRNPIDRVASHYFWLQSLGLECRSLLEAFEYDAKEEPDFARPVGGRKFRYYKAESLYGRYVPRYIEAFGRDQVLILTTEDLRDQPSAVLQECTDFLGIDPFFSVAPRWENRTQSNPAPGGIGADPKHNSSSAERLTLGDRQYLQAIFSPDISQLRSVTGISFSQWQDDFPISPAEMPIPL